MTTEDPGRQASYQRLRRIGLGVPEVLAGSFLLPLVAVYGLLVARSQYWPHALALTWYAIAGCGLLGRALWKGKRLDLFLPLVVLNVFVLTPELVLRWAGFRYESGVEFGYPRPEQFRRFAPHAELFWTLPPGSPGVDEMGLPAAPSDGGDVCVLFLGDSVPFQGYPAIVETFLRAAGGDCRVLNWSLPGYSSHQGRVLVDVRGEHLRAGVAVISYGWNDHWQAWGARDADKVVAVGASFPGRLAAMAVRRSRLVQLARRLVAAGPSEPLAEPRVTLAEYRENLAALGESLVERGVRPVFVTPPSGHARLGVPDFLVERGFARDAARVLADHPAYNQVVRELSRERGWPLIDLEAELALHDDPAAIFLEDGIHLTERGAALVAHLVAEPLSELLHLPDERDPPGAHALPH